MSLYSWLLNLRSALALTRGQRQHRRRSAHWAPTHRPSLEALEDRSVPAFVAPVDYTVSDYPLDYPFDMKVGDFNNDGRFDLVTANPSYSKTVSVLLGNDDGTFQPARTSAAGDFFPASLAVGDFNEDGKLDLAMDAGYGHLGILLGQGDGTFALHTSFSLGFDSVSSFATGDLNADSKLDLVVMSRDNGSGANFVNVLVGHGDGSFAHVTTTPDYAETWLALADFDGDSNLDLAGSGWVQLGNGDGTFQEPRGLGVGGFSPTVADFDADGNLDLATNNYSGTVSVVLGNGDGSFQAAQSFAAGPAPYAVSAADVNGDGVLDLVVTNSQNAGRLTALLGNGDGSFGLPITAAVGSFPTSLVVADFNADGRPDAAVTHATSAKVTVLLNDGNWSTQPLPPPSISISDFSQAEGKKGKTTLFTFTVMLSAPYDQAVTMSYRTVNGTATTSNSDYIAKTGTLTFAPGETTKTITIEVKGDSKREANETFYLDLFGNSSNSQFTKNRGLGTILNDD